MTAPPIQRPAIRPLAELFEGAGFVDGMTMFCGTLKGIGRMRPVQSCRVEVRTPHRNKSVTLSYDSTTQTIIA